METIFFFNKGRDAKRAGLPREAPETIEYPIISQYVPFHYETGGMSIHQQREWLRGYDHATN